MTRKRKSRRRMVYSTTFGFHDGAVIGCAPDRKPSPKRVKEDGLHVDEDGVFSECLYSPTYWHSWELEQRHEATVILANRLNTRRSIRELVLPELAAMQSVLSEIHERLLSIEERLDKLPSCRPR